MPNDRGVALVIGAGDGLGGGIARRFASEGYHVCAIRRTEAALKELVEQIQRTGGTVTPFGIDGRQEDQVVELFNRIEREIGEIEIVVFNLGGNKATPIRETSAEVFTKIWQLACFAGFLAGREAARHMSPRGRGTILFTGATASWRGKAAGGGFASAKSALRMLAQAMARELGPEGIHVAHVIIDGAIDMPKIRASMGDRLSKRGEDAYLSPDDMAETYWNLHCQPRSAWTHEVELRPWVEPW